MPKVNSVSMENKKITFDRFIRGCLSLAVLVAAVLLFNRLSSVLLPFFLAWVIAYLLYPLVGFFQYRLRMRSRALAITCTLVVVGSLGVAAFMLLVPPMISEVGRLHTLLNNYLEKSHLMDDVPLLLAGYIDEYLNPELIRQVLSGGGVVDALRTGLPTVWGMLTESVNILFGLFTAFLFLLYLIFILLDYEALSEGWIELLPDKYRTFATTLVTDIQDGMNRYFRGQALVALCVGILFSIGFLIIDFPMAIALGLFIGLLNMVPYLQVLGFIPTLLLALLKSVDTGQSFWMILALAGLVFLVVQIIQDGFLVPRIMGKITGLNPAIILLSLSIWGSLMGMLGLIIALPLTTLLLSYYRRFVIRKEHIRRIECHAPLDKTVGE